MIRISHWRETTVKQILVSEERNKNPKEQDCESHSLTYYPSIHKTTKIMLLSISGTRT